MPVRSLNSSVLKWPDAKTVDEAARRWAQKLARDDCNILKIGYFGSYARGDWGVGSDLDVIVILKASREPFEKRSIKWDTAGLPVATDILVYTKAEWQSMGNTRFYRTIMQECVWIYTSNNEDSSH